MHRSYSKINCSNTKVRKNDVTHTHISFLRCLLFMKRRRATVHESLKHSWICFDGETPLLDEQIIDSLKEEQEEVNELKNG